MYLYMLLIIQYRPIIKYMTVLHLLLTSSGKGGRRLNDFNVEEWIKAILIDNNYMLIINTWAFQVLFFTEIVFVIKSLQLDLLAHKLVLSLIACYLSKTKTRTKTNKDRWNRPALNQSSTQSSFSPTRRKAKSLDIRALIFW